MIDIKKAKEAAEKAWEPTYAVWAEERRVAKEKRKLQRKCFWTWPWGHVPTVTSGWYGERHCAVCDKWLR
jgi:hypothetical protein